MDPKTIIFIGPQGSGKGTQIERLARELRERDPKRRTVDIQTGRRFRALAAKGEGYTEKSVHETLDSGVLQPLFLSVVLWGDAFHHHVDADCHLLIDGFPRTVNEARVLESALSFYKRSPLTVINLDAPEDVVRERMTSRARPDDTPASIEARLRWYREETMPVLAYYRSRADTVVLDCDGTKPIDEVQSEILRHLELI
ncbi:MAG TPA: nucleoside monophosphate kinase [Candidatus Paceibacterota bacterium]|nr:nucleoside monophosphate kinase [Candidatus Paceibacterota bacterium]